MEAIILAGGFGTRLQHVVNDVPKPMAPINEVPFLKYIFDQLSKYKVNKIILAVGYKSDVIINYFGNRYKEIDIIYSKEETPLFTGGAIKKALDFCKNKNVFIINGDTYFDINLNDMFDFHVKNKSNLTVAIKEMYNFDRYGTAELKDQQITKFHEKQAKSSGYINGGIYILNKEILNKFKLEKFSFEQDFMEKKVSDLLIMGFKSKNYFIDIGVPDDYYKAQKDLPKRSISNE